MRRYITTDVTTGEIVAEFARRPRTLSRRHYGARSANQVERDVKLASALFIVFAAVLTLVR